MLLDVAQPDPTTGFRDPETWEIYVMNADGTGLKNLSNRPGKDNSARWSPDGKLIVFESIRTGYYGTGAGDIYVMDADGTNVRRLTDDPADDMLPRWSPERQVDIFHQLQGDRPGTAQGAYQGQSRGDGLYDSTRGPRGMGRGRGWGRERMDDEGRRVGGPARGQGLGRLLVGV